MRLLTIFWLVPALAFPQSATLTPEAPQQARNLLNFAAKLDADAKRAVTAGQAHVLLKKRAPAAPGEQLIEQRAETGNGIYVDQPKVYDDSLLQQMLGSAESRLSSLQGLDQSGLTKALGNVSGANQQISSFGASGGAQPPVTITPGGTTVTSPFVIPSPAAPGLTSAQPSSEAPSASDILNEQLQLTSEIANLRLLLEGSLSDQLMVAEHETFAKPRVTLGFPVVISPAKRYKNAVAVVEVLAGTNPKNDASPGGEPPSITALLPREKTYNVASISDKSKSLGAGIATATAGASATFLWGHKQYFIVKDQDTLAAPFALSKAELGALAAQGVDSGRLRAFGWQFRPVLGRAFVEAGSRQVFVQLAFPGRGSVSIRSFGDIRVRTYWRALDPKTGLLQGVIPGSLVEGTVHPIPNYDMRQKSGPVAAFNSSWMEDLGNGQMLIKLEGRLLPGTYLRVGSNIILPAAGSVPSDLKTTRFVVNIADLAHLNTFVISRDGTEFPLKIEPGGINRFRVDQPHVKVTSLDDSTVLLQVPITNFITSQDIPPVLLLGGKVFGYSDAPIDRTCNPAGGVCTLSVALPKTFLASNPVVRVKALMVDEDGPMDMAANRTFSVFPQTLAAEKLIYLSHDKDTATYLLYGHDLKGAKLLWPAANADLKPLPESPDEGSMRLLTMALEVAKDASAVVLARAGKGERPFQVAVPALPKADDGGKEKKKEVKFQERVVVNADEATIVGEKLDTVTAVLFGAKPLKIAQRTSTEINLTGLRAAGVTAAAKTQEITLVGLSGDNKVALEVVSSKVEVTQK